MSLYLDMKSLFTKQGFTITAVAKEFNHRNGTDHTIQNFSKRLRNETFTYKEITEILDIVGYTLVWTPKSE